MNKQTRRKFLTAGAAALGLSAVSANGMDRNVDPKTSRYADNFVFSKGTVVCAGNYRIYGHGVFYDPDTGRDVRMYWVGPIDATNYRDDYFWLFSWRIETLTKADTFEIPLDGEGEVGDCPPPLKPPC